MIPIKYNIKQQHCWIEQVSSKEKLLFFPIRIIIICYAFLWELYKSLINMLIKICPSGGDLVVYSCEK